jgi:hypothetical protein
MAYTRRYSGRNNFQGNVKVALAWNTTSGTYSLQFTNIGSKWNSVKAVIDWLKMTIPSGERDYDDVSKVWYLHEKHFPTLKTVLEANPDFDTNIIGKPEGQTSQVTFVSMDTYLQIFNDITGVDINTLDYAQALKKYRVCAMRLHPDRGGDEKLMSSFNVAWDNIKERHFKIEKPKMEALI